MSCSKRIRVALLTSSSSFSFVNDIFYNYDLLSIIFRNLRIIEILSVIQTNSFLYNYIKTNDKSLHMTKHCIRYDFGDILSSKYFKFNFKSSLQLIECV